MHNHSQPLPLVSSPSVPFPTSMVSAYAPIASNLPERNEDNNRSQIQLLVSAW